MEMDLQGKEKQESMNPLKLTEQYGNEGISNKSCLVDKPLKLTEQYGNQQCCSNQSVLDMSFKID